MPLHVQVAVGTPPALDDGAVVGPVAAERIDHAPVAHHRHALLSAAAERLLHRLDGIVLRLRRGRCLHQRLLEAADLGQGGGGDRGREGAGRGAVTWMRSG